MSAELIEIGYLCLPHGDKCVQDGVCVRHNASYVCRARCLPDRSCPEGYHCTFSAASNEYTPVCLPSGWPKQSREGGVRKSEIHRLEAENIFFIVFGAIFLVIVYNVLRMCCCGSREAAKEARLIAHAKEKQAPPQHTYQHAPAYHVPSCPTCATQFAHVNPQRPPPNYTFSAYRQV